MAALAALARGIGKILGLLTRWLDGLRAPRNRPIPLRPIAGASDGTEEESPNGAARRSLVPRWLAERRTAFFNALAALGLLIFGGLTALVDLGLTADADLALTTAVQTAQLPLFGGLMWLASLPGFPPYTFVLVGGAVSLLVLAGLRTEAGFTLLASASSLITAAVKELMARPRPTPELVRVESIVGGHSFPSGHTLFYVTFFGFLGYLAYALLKPSRLRTALLWACGLLILLVGPSRIWLGHHWASDVLASYALGLAYLVCLVQVYARFRLRARSATQLA